MNKNDYQVDIFVGGKPVRQYYHDGQTYVEAKVGSEYSIRVKNNSFGRKLAVITVDGINVISGIPNGSEVGRGYIIRPKDSIQISGFRKDLHEVGAFKFCDKNSAYCNQKGLEGNNGVIGVRIYGEQEIMVSSVFIESPIYWADPYPAQQNEYTVNCSTSYTSQPAHTLGPCSSSSQQFDVGTTWGRKIEDASIEVDFNTDQSDFSEFIIYYDSTRNLQKRGIQLSKQTSISSPLPKAFGPFASPPEGWRG